MRDDKPRPAMDGFGRKMPDVYVDGVVVGEVESIDVETRAGTRLVLEIYVPKYTKDIEKAMLSGIFFGNVDVFEDFL